jgi:hypothetical protein
VRLTEIKVKQDLGILRAVTPRNLSIALMLEAENTSETSVKCQSIRRNNPGYRQLHTRQSDNVNSHGIKENEESDANITGGFVISMVAVYYQRRTKQGR